LKAVHVVCKAYAVNLDLMNDTTKLLTRSRLIGVKGHYCNSLNYT
jgi:hypothetical protein